MWMYASSGRSGLTKPTRNPTSRPSSSSAIQDVPAEMLEPQPRAAAACTLRPPHQSSTLRDEDRVIGLGRPAQPDRRRAHRATPPTRRRRRRRTRADERPEDLAEVVDQRQDPALGPRVQPDADLAERDDATASATASPIRRPGERWPPAPSWSATATPKPIAPATTSRPVVIVSDAAEHDDGCRADEGERDRDGDSPGDRGGRVRRRVAVLGGGLGGAIAIRRRVGEPRCSPGAPGSAAASVGRRRRVGVGVGHRAIVAGGRDRHRPRHGGASCRTLDSPIVSHPSLGLPPLDRTAGFPDAAARIRTNGDRLAARALRVALDARPDDRATRYDEAGLRQLLRDAELLAERVAFCVAAGDPGPPREYAEWTAPALPPPAASRWTTSIAPVRGPPRGAARASSRRPSCRSPTPPLDAAIERLSLAPPARRRRAQAERRSCSSCTRAAEP